MGREKTRRHIFTHAHPHIRSHIRPFALEKGSPKFGAAVHITPLIRVVLLQIEVFDSQSRTAEHLVEEEAQIEG
jgi:hypothetical protein